MKRTYNSFAKTDNRDYDTHLWCPHCGTFKNPSYSTVFTYSKDKKKIGIKCTKCGASIKAEYVDWETAKRFWIAYGKSVLQRNKEAKLNRSGYKWGYGMELEEYANEVYGGDLLDW